MKLSKKEQELILKMREEENMNRPVKVGFLKHDIYDNFCSCLRYGNRISDIEECFPNDPYITAEEFESGMEQFMKLIKTEVPILTKGTQFFCYRYDGFEQTWSDSESNWIEEISDDWAQKHLENIRDIDGTFKVKYSISKKKRTSDEFYTLKDVNDFIELLPHGVTYTVVDSHDEIVKEYISN